MKIIQINCVYNKGSTGKIVYDIHKQLLKENYDSIVCYGRGNKSKEINVYKICSEIYAKFNKLVSMINGVPYGGCYFSTNKLIAFIKKENPNIVHLHCINGNFVNIYRLINFLKAKKIKTILTLHAEFMYTGGCTHSINCIKWKEEKGCYKCPIYKSETKSLFFDRSHSMWKRMYNAFKGFQDNLTVVSVSTWLQKRAESSIILKNFNHLTILNGLDCETFKPKEYNDLKIKHSLTNEKIIFHVTPNFNNDINNIKGGYYVIKLAEELKNYNIKIIVAGHHQPSLEVPENIILLGNVSNQNELAKYYSLADVTIISSKKETFSMIVAESLCCGTPIVGFKAGAPEEITLKEYSDFVEFGNLKLLKDAINKWLNAKIDSKEIHKTAKEKYDKSNMISKYLNLYSKNN